MSARDDDFSSEDTTKVTPEEIQKELLKDDTDTDPSFKDSEFWFRFQNMEQEILSLKDGYRMIYSIMKIYWNRVEDIPNEHMRMIFGIARDVVEGIPPDEDIITITT